MSEASFMGSIHNFDKCIKSNKLTDEELEYCKAMKKIFEAIEILNHKLNSDMKKLMQSMDNEH